MRHHLRICKGLSADGIEHMNLTRLLYAYIYIYLHIYISYITYLVRAQRSTCCLFSFARHLVGKMVIQWNSHHDQHSLGVFIYIITPNITTEVYVHVIIM